MDDWWLKVKRAEKHMVDIKQEAIRYASSNPYSFTRVRLPDSQKGIRYRFRITQQPDPMIALMLGDFVHNLRSALDYVVVACVPKQHRKHVGFPIVFQDIFAKGKNGQFVVDDPTALQNFETTIEGLHPKARALIIQHQPYNLGVDPGIITLGIISRLENADKHRQLLTIGCGGQDKDDTVIPFPYPEESLIPPSKVDMHLTGTAKIFVKVARIGGNQPPGDFLLDTLLDSMLFEVKGILKKLELFVRST